MCRPGPHWEGEEPSAPGDIEREVEQRLKDGFRTFKIKVGKSAEDDARRVKLVQRAIARRVPVRRTRWRDTPSGRPARYANAALRIVRRSRFLPIRLRERKRYISSPRASVPFSPSLELFAPRRRNCRRNRIGSGTLSGCPG